MIEQRGILVPALLTISMCSFLLLFGANPLEAGNPAPDFTLPSINGKSISLDDFEGRPLLLVFWNSTGPPCIEELPVLEALEEEFAAQNLAVVTVSADPLMEDARSALREANVELMTLMDESKSVMRAYSISATPATYLIDGNGTIVMNSVGYGKETEERLRSKIRELLKE